jgi:hypothetical protein
LRRLFCILLLVCLPLQSFAMQLGGLHALVEAGLQHEIAHDQGVEHHHDDNGAVHYDDSDESSEHVQHDCAGPCQCLLPEAAAASPPERLQGELALIRLAHIPDPDLEDPERPPVFAPGLTAGG